jgi:hypothetical protein
MSTFPATQGVSNKNSSYDALYQKNEDEFKYPTNYPKIPNQYANTLYMNKLQYYDSPVQNAHSYPNMFHIKPVDFNEKQSDVGMFLNKSIEKNKQFLYGGVLHNVKRIDVWN